ncbi:hypothetical protein J437_LFUL002542 [Ladona fulva]|uniref:PiggyBac transposable element-derived protein domain-containing protein n=1 Tax=Ladona fulva TaxID=123851 RepID=A0A8K0KRW7_LADFU|nr:hypothetical protein J437_LFUL002542 [Ladona fulva]
MRAFIGILIVSGYNVLPGKKYYWDTKKDVHNELISGAMRRDRFIQIMKFLHLADNTKLDRSDRFYKVRPMVKIIKQKCLQNFVPSRFLDYDEAMIKYYGRHSCKQFIRGKPIRFGYKAWCLNTDAGYLIDFDFYQGKNPFSNAAHEEAVGKAAAPLLAMLEEIPKKELPYSIFFDNLFTGEGIVITKWLDNSVVVVASTAYGVAPLMKVKRFCRKQKKIIQLSQPYAISQYNKHMGGTDRMDEDVNSLRIGRQLRAEAEIRLATNERIGGGGDDGAKMPMRRKWIKGGMKCTGNFPDEDYSTYSNLSCVELLELFIDDELIRFIVEESEKYARFLNCPSPQITAEEMRAFIGILIVSGYNVLPGKKYYCDTKKDVHNELISGAMRRDRFIQIMKFQHLADNTKLDEAIGKNPFSNAAHEEAVGKAAAPLLAMLEEIPKKELPYSIFFDNLFTGK